LSLVDKNSNIIREHNKCRKERNCHDEVKLICSSEQEKAACSFTSPSGWSYNILKGNNYDNLRIQAYETENNLYDCAMLITSIKESDRGTWNCNVTTAIPYYQIATNSIKVIIGSPPPPIEINSGNDITVEKKEIVTRIGDEVKLICSSEQQRIACIFTSPSGRSYNMLKGNKYDNLRIQAYETENDLYDCGMLITNIKESDMGTWNCNVTTSIPYYQINRNSIKVIIATPPNDVYMRKENERITGVTNVKLEDTTKIDCVASGGYPAPQFNWTTSNSPLIEPIIEMSEEDLEDGNRLYISTLTYVGDPRHADETLKCKVIHEGYEDRQIRQNGKLVTLNLKFKPQIPPPFEINLNNNQPISIKCNSPGALPAIYYVCEGSCLCKISGSNRGKILYCDDGSENEQEAEEE